MFLRFFILLFASISLNTAHSSDSKVLASIHPLALIAASIVAPKNLDTLLDKGSSPHHFNLKPSHIKRIQQADIIIWAGAQVEPYLARFAARKSTHQIWLDMSKIATNSHIQDPHKWLHIDSAIALQKQLSQHLKQDPTPFNTQITHTKKQLKTQLTPYQNEPFFVFHQAYDYWVEEFQLSQQKAFSEHAQHKIGLHSALKIRQQLQQQKVRCIFSEAQLSDKLIRSVANNLNITQIQLDPMGYQITPSKNAYRDFLIDMGNRFRHCLSHTKTIEKKP